MATGNSLASQGIMRSVLQYLTGRPGPQSNSAPFGHIPCPERKPMHLGTDEAREALCSLSLEREGFNADDPRDELCRLSLGWEQHPRP